MTLKKASFRDFDIEIIEYFCLFQYNFGALESTQTSHVSKFDPKKDQLIELDPHLAKFDEMGVRNKVYSHLKHFFGV